MAQSLLSWRAADPLGLFSRPGAGVCNFEPTCHASPSVLLQQSSQAFPFLVLANTTHQVLEVSNGRNPIEDFESVV